MYNLDQSARWYLVQVKPNSAEVAQRHLKRQEFETFLPLEQETRRRGGRFVSIKRPFFPGYLFVSANRASGPWRAICSTRGVSQLVRTGNQPAVVPAHVIMDLQNSCDHNGCVRPSISLAEGDDVRVASGPFSGFMGRVQKTAPHQRPWILLEIMGHATNVSIPQADLRRQAC